MSGIERGRMLNSKLTLRVQYGPRVPGNVHGELEVPTSTDGKHLTKKPTVCGPFLAAPASITKHLNIRLFKVEPRSWKYQASR